MKLPVAHERHAERDIEAQVAYYHPEQEAPGGRLAGQLFGEQDDRAALPDRTHHAREQPETLLAPHLYAETLRTDLYGPDPEARHPKRWHVFHVVARRPHGDR